jgi:hypothetical protein
VLIICTKSSLNSGLHLQLISPISFCIVLITPVFAFYSGPPKMEVKPVILANHTIVGELAILLQGNVFATEFLFTFL